jgi:peptide/nickel transport system ATP-binding protein
LPTATEIPIAEARTSTLLSVRNLSVEFPTEEGLVRAVRDVSFNIEAGKTHGLVGESGCGKSVTSMAIMRLLAHPGRISSGQIFYHDQSGKSGNNGAVDLTKISDPAMRSLRGSRIAMIFQEPMTSLNPVFTIGNQLGESLQIHEGLSKRAARDRAIELMDKVRIPHPSKRVDDYPHQFSGGMRQRVMIAMALACSPQLLIADEPTTALDVTIQAQILDLLRKLQAETGMAILLITHDLGVIAEMADHVTVMYASQVVESAPVNELFTHPLHPYTLGLFRSRPQPGSSETLFSIPGMVPSPVRLPGGCFFHPRCQWCQEPRCTGEHPELRELRPGHLVRCHRAEEIQAGAAS